MTNKYGLMQNSKVTHEIIPIPPLDKTRTRGGGWVAVKKLNSRAEESLLSNDMRLIAGSADGYTVALIIDFVEGGATATEIAAGNYANIMPRLLALLNKPGEAPDFEIIKKVTKGNGKQATPKTDELLVLDDAEIIEAIDGEESDITISDLVLDPRLKAVLINQINSIVPDAKDMSEAHKITIANNMVYTRCPIIGQDGFYYYPDKGKVVIVWGYGLLLKVARYMDKVGGGNGQVEFREESLTDDELKMLNVNDGDTAVKLRMLSSSNRKEHHQAMLEFNETVRDWVNCGASFKEALEEAKLFYPHINNAVGVVGYGVFRKGGYSHKSWTTYDMAKKYALKNLIKTNFSMPTKQDWAAIAEGTISQMNDTQFAEFLAERGEFLKYKGVGTRELNLLASGDNPEPSNLTQTERVNLMRGVEGDDEVN